MENERHPTPTEQQIMHSALRRSVETVHKGSAHNAEWRAVKSDLNRDLWNVQDEGGWRIAACKFQEHAELVAVALNKLHKELYAK